MRITVSRALVGWLAAWNVLINRVIPEHLYVPANLLAAGATYGAARLAGHSARELGTSTTAMRRGVALGIGGAAVAAGGAFVASKLELTRDFFNDARVHEDDVVYQTLVRIPCGTVVLEEVAFRSVLPAVLHDALPGDVSQSSALAFGLWHVLPTLSTLDINGVTDPAVRRQAVVMGVAATALAGMVLDSLQRRSRSVLTPMLLHWGINAAAYALAARYESHSHDEAAR